MEFNFFDSLFDATIVVDESRKIVYCNESAATMAGSSVRRLSKGIIFSDIFVFQGANLYPMDGGEEGKSHAAPMRELAYSIKSNGKTGLVQVTVQPFQVDSSQRWIIIMHDVTLEETLHSKYQGELEQREVYINELKSAKSQLEHYSKNLEKMVEERTQELRSANRMLNAIMNSLGQGFLVFDENGICSNVYTKACEEVLEAAPVDKPIWTVLRMGEFEGNQFRNWMKAAFAESLPFESMVDLAPTLYQHSLNRHITLNFYPIRNESGKISNIVLVATDRTREHAAEQALRKEQNYIQMVLKIIKNREQFSLFLKNSKTLISRLKHEVSWAKNGFDFGEAFRLLHTLEGEAGLFSAASIRESARICQEAIEPFKRGGRFDEKMVLADLEAGVLRLEDDYASFLDQNKELLQVLRVSENRKVELNLSQLIEFANLMDLKRAPSEVVNYFRDHMLKQPLGLFLRHFNEVAQHVAQFQGKQLNPVMFDCDQVKVWPGRFDNLFATFVHAFRNAVDHGIESPETRLENGKSARGQVSVKAENFVKDGKVWIRVQIEDDGGGIDPNRLREKLAQKFKDEDFSQASDKEILQTIFRAGFSSRDDVGQFSGRGVGMDAIKTEVMRFGGDAHVESEIGKGSRFTIEFPDIDSDNSILAAAS